jgi:hypothetical protein
MGIGCRPGIEPTGCYVLDCVAISSKNIERNTLTSRSESLALKVPGVASIRLARTTRRTTVYKSFIDCLIDLRLA